MRGLVCAAILLTSIAVAHAEEGRTVPPVGAKLTYRLVTTTKTPANTISSGQVYTYIVTKSDGTTAEGIIKPEAIILNCEGGPADLACQDAAKTPNAHFDGNLLTVPVESASGDALSRQSAFKLTHFLVVLRKFPIPSSRDPKEYNLHDFGPDPSYLLTNTLQCDLAGLAAFLPFGKSPQITLPCETSFERSASRDGRLPLFTSHEAVTIEITDAGTGSVTLPSGNWQIHKLIAKNTPKEPGRPSSESEALFSTQLGAIVRYHLIGTDRATQSTTEILTELVSVSP